MTIQWDDVKATVREGHIHWQDLFDERQQKEIAFDNIYAYSFSHGTDGHNARLIIAKMSQLLDAIAGHITFTMEIEEPK